MADTRALTVKRNRRVKVFVRTRPTPYFAHDKLEILPENKSVCVHCSRNEEQGYINNQVLDWNFKMDGILHNISQDDSYDAVARDAVTGAMDGYNATIMAYGQTGAGKTFTMTGDTGNYRLRGIIPRAVSQVFQEAHSRQESSIKVSISYVEIYNEMMYDLLATLPDQDNASCTPLVIAEDNKGNVYVKGLSIRLAENEEEALNMLFEGETNRVIGSHSLNTNSSRSHCVFTLHIESRSRTKSTAQYTISKLNLVDLAGSERLNKTHSTGSTEREALYINKSLSFLEQVIIALADKKRDHIPYRQSKLTHLLKDSLGGNCHTLMIANIWGEAAQMEETISTLRFASRMMCVSNEPIQNVLQDPVLLVQQYEKELDALRQELAMHDLLANRASVSYEPLTEGEKEDIQRQVRQYLDGSLAEIEIINVRQIKETFSQLKGIIQNMETEMEERLQSIAELKQFATPVQSSSSGVATTAVPRMSSKGNAKTTKVNLPLQPSNEDSELVGDTDGQGFGIGVAPNTAKQSISPIAATKKWKSKLKKYSVTKPPMIGDSLTVGGPLISSGEVSQHSLEQARAGSRSGSPETISDKKLNKPSTPPPPQEAFEEFKKTRGVNINQILMESKEKLQARKKNAVDLSKSINETKRHIDQLRMQVEDRGKKRLETTGDLITDNGEVVMDEDEYTAVVELKKMKQQYRSLYDSLTALKKEIQFCQNKVDQSRQKMMEEFDLWYKQCYLGDNEQQSNDPPQVVESNQELFDKVQAQLLDNDINTQAFYHARTRTDKRLLAGSVKRKPGAVTSNVKNKPPTLLTVT